MSHRQALAGLQIRPPASTAGRPGYEFAELSLGAYADLYVSEVEPGAEWRIEALAAAGKPVDDAAVEAMERRIAALLPQLPVEWAAEPQRNPAADGDQA